MDFEAVYRSRADEYDRMVSAEDCDGVIIPALAAIAPLAGAAVLEVGAGTGRLTRLLRAAGARVVASDRAPAMLAVARRRGAPFLLADAGALPVASAWADLAVAGWVFGHLRLWQPGDWKAAIGRALDEMQRTLRPGGASVVLETLGTGATEPAPPTSVLAEYYAWLECERGFERRALRTDYAFSSPEEAAQASEFFFGDDLAARVRREKWSRVPECTGIWWRRHRGDLR